MPGGKKKGEPTLAATSKKNTKAKAPKAAAAAATPPPTTPRTPSKRRQAESFPPAAKKVKSVRLTVENFIPKELADLVLTCGNGDTGQLGHGEDVTVAKRPRVIKSFPDGVKFLQAVAGGMHTVVLTSNFEVFTAGCNDGGALGRVCCDDDGNQVDKDEDFIFRKVKFPDDCGDLVMISAGDSHTAALTRDGSVFIWGTFRDKAGPLGLTIQNRTKQVEKATEPILLSSKKDRIVVKIASGSDHILMLTDKGKVLSSGAGDAGQLGRLSQYFRESGVSERARSRMMIPTDINITKLSVSFVNIWCATYCSFAQAADGKIYVWGLNNYHQLGLIPTDREQMDVHYPTVSERFESTKIWKGFSGDHHILAVDDKGNCHGIGRGDDCRLGQGQDKCDNSDSLVKIGSTGAVGVAAATGTSFMWKRDGSAFAWGLNNEAELGLGVEEGSVVNEPKEIEFRSVQDGVRVLQISANSQHTVFLAARKGDGNQVGSAA